MKSDHFFTFPCIFEKVYRSVDLVIHYGIVLHKSFLLTKLEAYLMKKISFLNSWRSFFSPIAPGFEFGNYGTILYLTLHRCFPTWDARPTAICGSLNILGDDGQIFNLLPFYMKIEFIDFFLLQPRLFKLKNGINQRKCQYHEMRGKLSCKFRF